MIKLWTTYDSIPLNYNVEDERQFNIDFFEDIAYRVDEQFEEGSRFAVLWCNEELNQRDVLYCSSAKQMFLLFYNMMDNENEAFELYVRHGAVYCQSLVSRSGARLMKVKDNATDLALRNYTEHYRTSENPSERRRRYVLEDISTEVQYAFAN